MLRTTTIITKWGNSLAIRLPRKILKEVLLSENERVELIADKTGIRIQKIDKTETLDDLFRGYNGKYEYHEIDTGSPIGIEV